MPSSGRPDAACPDIVRPDAAGPDAVRPDADSRQTSDDHRPEQLPRLAQQTSAQLRPRFADGDCSQAPCGPQDLELALRQVKRRILATYKNHRSPEPNFSRAQGELMKDLQP